MPPEKKKGGLDALKTKAADKLAQHLTPTNIGTEASEDNYVSPTGGYTAKDAPGAAKNNFEPINLSPEDSLLMNRAAAGSPPTYAHAQKMNDLVRQNAALESQFAGDLASRHVVEHGTPFSAGEQIMLNRFPNTPNTFNDWDNMAMNFYRGSQQPSNIPSVNPNSSGLAAMKGRR